MCGRYRRTTSEEELARLYHIPIPSQTDLPISYNVAPSQKILAIRFNPKSQQRSLDAVQWGLIPYWAKDPKIAYRTINARAESVDKAPSFRQAFAKRRCLIPADGFYEWRKTAIPVRTPGQASGNVTRRKVASQPLPRHHDASISRWSTVEIAAVKGWTANGKL